MKVTQWRLDHLRSYRIVTSFETVFGRGSTVHEPTWLAGICEIFSTRRSSFFLSEIGRIVAMVVDLGRTDADCGFGCNWDRRTFVDESMAEDDNEQPRYSSC